MIWFLIAVAYMAWLGHRQRVFIKLLTDQYSSSITLCADTMEHCADVIDKLCDDDGADDTRVRAAAKARDAAGEVRCWSEPINITHLQRHGNVLPIRPIKKG